MTVRRPRRRRRRPTRPRRTRSGPPRAPGAGTGSAPRAQRWNRLPSVQLSSNYQRFGYPAEGTILPNSFGLFYPNWTASLGFSFPVFSGGRLTGDQMVAEANLVEARETLAQVRDLAALDARTALTQLEQADAADAASVGAG